MTARYLGMNRSDGLTVTDLEHISQSIGDILRTPVGSRVMRRDYGSLLASMSFFQAEDGIRDYVR
mgnify:CR=1 FL=1